MNNKESLRIERAVAADADAVFALYRSLVHTPYCTWSEDYPTRDIVEYDIAHFDVFVLRNEDGRVISAIVSAEDDEMDGLTSWFPDVRRWALLVRLGVAQEEQGKGIARTMLEYAMAQARTDGYDGVRFLVSPENLPAQRSYAKLGCDICGEADHYGMHWLCYQKRL